MLFKISLPMWLFFACSTVSIFDAPVPYEPAVFSPEKLQAEVSHLLEEEKPFLALNLLNNDELKGVNSLSLNGGISFAEQKETAISLLQKKTKDYWNTFDYQAFYAGHASLVQLDAESELPELEWIHLDYTLYFFREEKSGAAFELIRRALENHWWTDDSYLNLSTQQRDDVAEKMDMLFEFLAESGNASLYNILTQEVATSWVPEVRTLPDERKKSEEIFQSVITIWADLGYSVDRGFAKLDSSLGSGFFIDSNGYIITNYHVVSSEVDPEYEGVSRLYVYLTDEMTERVPATVVGWNEELDLALIKIAYSSPQFLNLEKDNQLDIGQKVSAVGSPIGLTSTVTAGTVSHIGRRILPTIGVTQIDAPINPGNSGGPVLNENQDVIGIAFSGVPDFQGLSFVIPTSVLRGVLPLLYSGGKVESGWLGIGIFETYQGLEVSYIDPSSSLSRTTIDVGDYILKVNNKPVTTLVEFRKMVTESLPNSFLRVEWQTPKGEIKTELFGLGAREDNPSLALTQRDSLINLLLPFYGLGVRYIGEGSAKKSNFTISRIISGGIADRAGLSVGDESNILKWQVIPDKEVGVLFMTAISQKRGYFENTLSMPVPLRQDSLF